MAKVIKYKGRLYEAADALTPSGELASKAERELQYAKKLIEKPRGKKRFKLLKHR